MKVTETDESSQRSSAVPSYNAKTKTELETITLSNVISKTDRIMSSLNAYGWRKSGNPLSIVAQVFIEAHFYKNYISHAWLLKASNIYMDDLSVTAWNLATHFRHLEGIICVNYEPLVYLDDIIVAT